LWRGEKVLGSEPGTMQTIVDLNVRVSMLVTSASALVND
jgi:hypothetical protein